MNIRDLAILESAATRTEELISACRVRGSLYCHDIALCNDVMRKAKGLRTSLGKLRASLDDPRPQPRKENDVKKEPLSLRLYYEAPLYELARLVSYGGIREADLKEQLKPLVEAHGDKMSMALFELTVIDEKTRIVSLWPLVRKACGQLLGPAPEHPEYLCYWEIKGKPPPENHQPPAVEEAPKKPAKRKK